MFTFSRWVSGLAFRLACEANDRDRHCHLHCRQCAWTCCLRPLDCTGVVDCCGVVGRPVAIVVARKKKAEQFVGANGARTTASRRLHSSVRQTGNRNMSEHIPLVVKVPEIACPKCKTPMSFGFIAAKTVRLRWVDRQTRRPFLPGSSSRYHSHSGMHPVTKPTGVQIVDSHC